VADGARNERVAAVMTGTRCGTMGALCAFAVYP